MELESIKDRKEKSSTANGSGYHQEDVSGSKEHNEHSVSTMKENDPLSDFQGVMLLIPTYIGIGFLGLPYAVKLLGLWAGAAGLFVYGLINEACVLMLAECSQHLVERTGKRPEDIASVVEMSAKVGPSMLQPHSNKLKVFVNALVFYAYVVLLLNMTSVMAAFGQDFFGKYVDFNGSLMILGISALSIPMYLTKRMKMIALMSTIANICTLVIFVMTFPYLVTDLPDQSTRPAVKYSNFIALTTFSNDAMFSYGGIAVVVPIRNRMRSTRTFDGWNGVLGVVLTFITCFHVACGFYGYLKFGESVQATYLLNLPQDSVFMTILKVLFVLSLYCSTGVIVFLPIDTVWGYIGKSCSSEAAKTYGEYIIRLILVILVCVTTMIIPEFELLMPLAGFGEICVIMVLPGYCKLCIMYGDADPETWKQRVKRWLTLTICYCLVVSGIYLAVSGLIVSIYMTAAHTIERHKRASI